MLNRSAPVLYFLHIYFDLILSIPSDYSLCFESLCYEHNSHNFSITTIDDISYSLPITYPYFLQLIQISYSLHITPTVYPYFLQVPHNSHNLPYLLQVIHNSYSLPIFPTIYPYLLQLNRLELVLTYSTRVACRTIPNKDMQLDTFRRKTGLTLTFRPRDVSGKFHDFVRTFQKATVTLTFAKRYTSKSSRYNTTMRYASYSLHARLRFSHWMHEESGGVCFVDLDLLISRCSCRLVII